MKKEIKYVCSLEENIEVLDSQEFDTLEEAEKAGLKAAIDFNKKIDEDIIEIFGEYMGENISEFYIFKSRNPEIPKNLGEYILDYISEDGEIAELEDLLGNDYFINSFMPQQIQDLNKVIHDWIDENTDDYGSYYLDLYKKVEVEK